ncbi:CDP-diacylglycerol-inositol 3-phosphatidyltransferase [Lambiella insularis]|nr:CDP-diacylglycerol-inositol 3-phosphatidyltransferase [Lambiella insularis]
MNGVKKRKEVKDARHEMRDLGQSKELDARQDGETGASENIFLFYPNIIGYSRIVLASVLFAFCALNELFFIALYLLSFSSPILSPSLLQPVPNIHGSSAQPGNPAHPPLFSLFPNPYSAGALELARANKMDSKGPWVVASICFPVMLGKQFINVVQLVKASRWLAEGDRDMRRLQGLPKNKKKK